MPIKKSDNFDRLFRAAPVAKPQLPPFNIERHVLVHEAGHLVLGHLEGIRGQGVNIPRQPINGESAQAFWDPTRVSNEQFVRRTVAGIHAQARYARESFRTSEALNALAYGLLPEARPDELRVLSDQAAEDLSYAATDLAQLRARIDGNLSQVVDFVTQHENYVRSVLARDDVAKAIEVLVQLMAEKIRDAEARGRTSAGILEIDYADTLGAILKF